MCGASRIGTARSVRDVGDGEPSGVNKTLESACSKMESGPQSSAKGFHEEKNVQSWEACRPLPLGVPARPCARSALPVVTVLGLEYERLID